MSSSGSAGSPAPVPELYLRVERRIPALARELLTQFIVEIPVYGRLPREQVEGEITAITENNLRIFFRGLRESRDPDEADLAELRASAARRAEERVPLDAVLTAYHVGARIGWQAMVDEASP